jgi:hypothetical protein
LINPKI